MTYSDKVKESNKVLEAMYGLKDGESIKVSYGRDRNGLPNYYKIRAYTSYNGEMSYSIWGTIHGMNIDKIGKTTMRGYTYDMMSQRTSYTFPLYSMHVLPEDKTK